MVMNMKFSLVLTQIDQFWVTAFNYILLPQGYHLFLRGRLNSDIVVKRYVAKATIGSGQQVILILFQKRLA